MPGNHLVLNRILYLFRFLIIIDREAREIIRLVASVRLSVRPSVCPSVRPSVRLSALSRLNRLTYDLDFWYEG